MARNLGIWSTLESEYEKTAERKRSVDNVLRRENPQQDQIRSARYLNWGWTGRRRSGQDHIDQVKNKLHQTIVERYNNDWIQKAKNQKVKNEEKLRKCCSSSFAQLRAPVKKPGRPKISRTSWWIGEPELRDELSEACNGHRAAEYDWMRLQLEDAKESWNSATLFFEKMVYVDEGRTDEPRSLPHFSFLLIKVSLSKCCRDSEESHDIRNQNSDEFASAIDSALFVLFFLPIDVITHCRQQCLSAHLAKSARHNSVTRFFFAGLWPLHSRL